MRRFLAGALVLSGTVTAAFACWQTGGLPVVLLAAQSLHMRVTNNEKAQRGLRFELHKAITFDVEEARRTGAFEKQILKSATTDALGLLSFGEVKPGNIGYLLGACLIQSRWRSLPRLRSVLSSEYGGTTLETGVSLLLPRVRLALQATFKGWVEDAGVCFERARLQARRKSERKVGALAAEVGA